MYSPPISFFFSSRRRHTRSTRDWSSDVCSSELQNWPPTPPAAMRGRSVIRVGSAGSRPCRSSHSRSLCPSMSGAARRRSSTAVGCYRASPIDRQPDPERSWLRDSHPRTRKDSALFRSYVRRGPDVRVDTRPRGELERLYRTQRGRMWQAVFAFAGDPEVASDAVAEAFTQALRRGDVIRSPERWLWAVWQSFPSVSAARPLVLDMRLRWEAISSRRQPTLHNS